MTAAVPTRMRLVAFRPMVKGALRGFASIELPNGLTIIDCPVCLSHGKVWASLPGKPMIDRDGRQLVSEGKPQYAAILKWRDRDLNDRFGATVVELVRASHPEALQ